MVASAEMHRLGAAGEIVQREKRMRVDGVLAVAGFLALLAAA